MKIKKFRASTPGETMRRVRSELGDEAVILSTRQIQDPIALAEGDRVEIVAAVDWDDAGVEREVTRRARERAPGPADAPADRPAQPSGAAPSADDTGLESQLEELKRLVRRLGSQVTAPDELALADVYRAVYAEMVANEVDAGLALRVVRVVKNQLADVEDRLRLGRAVQETMTSLLPSAPAEKKRIQVLIGPTGVGKTTTAAKLAARELLERRGPVVLATSDTYRVAAVEQLRGYAAAMGAGFDVVRGVAELHVLLKRHAEGHSIILDTEGRGQRDLMELEPLFRYVGGRSDIERHLVLSANTKPGDLHETIDRFRIARPDDLIFTKIDETNSYGPILSESVRSGLPVSYLGTGQRVPEELLVATPQKVAELAISALA